MSETFTARRYQRSLKRIERKTAKLRARLELLHLKKESKRITPAQHSRKKTVLDNRLRTLSARERTLLGALKQERSRQTQRNPTAAAAR